MAGYDREIREELEKLVGGRREKKEERETKKEDRRGKRESQGEGKPLLSFWEKTI